MFLKKFLTSVCIVSLLCVCVNRQANAGPGLHSVVDSPANSLLSKILAEEIADVAVKLADLNTFIDLVTSMGDPEQIASALNLNEALGNSIAGEAFGGLADSFSTVKETFDVTKDTVTDTYNSVKDEYDNVKKTYDDTMQVINDAKTQTENLVNTANETKNKVENLGNVAKESVGKAQDMAMNVVSDAKSTAAGQIKSAKGKATKVVGNISIPAELQDIGFAGAVKDSKQMSKLITDELLPPIEDGVAGGKVLTDAEKTERQQKRMALRDATAADAYALAVATQYEGSSVQEGSIASAKSRVDAAETLQERAAAALDVGLARVSQLVRGNEISAMSLRLQAAEAIANMPRDYES